MRRIWQYMNTWPSGWIGVPLAAVLAFGGGLFAGFVLLDDEASVVVPMAAALGVGGGIGAAWRMLRHKPQTTPVWSSSPPPPGRPD